VAIVVGAIVISKRRSTSIAAGDGAESTASTANSATV
jgi:hypothetical protein